MTLFAVWRIDCRGRVSIEEGRTVRSLLQEYRREVMLALTNIAAVGWQ